MGSSPEVLVEAPWQECIKHPPSPTQGSVSRGPVGRLDFPLCPAVMKHIPPQLSVETKWEPWAFPLTCYNPGPLPLKCQGRPAKMKDLNEIQRFTT